MAIYRVQTSDGSTMRIDGPDDATPEMVEAAAASYYEALTKPGKTPEEAPGLAEQAIGAGEAALTLGTGATSGTAGMIGGTLKGMAQQLLSGQFGTSEASQAIERAAAEGMAAGTYEPRTEAGRQQVQAVGEALAPLESLGAVAPMLGEIGAITQGAKMAGQAVKPAVSVAAGAAKELPIVQAAERGVAALTPEGPSSQAGKNLSAAAVQKATVRQAAAENLPIPLTGEKGLTVGQATRDFAQQQFEKEKAKLGKQGAPLRERFENQTEGLIQNFDAMIDNLQPIARDRRELGAVVDQALVNRAEVKRREIQGAYKKAREAGDMSAPIDMDPLVTSMNELQRFEGVSPNIGAIRKEALRLGALTDDGAGNLAPGKIAIDDAELLRQFVNESTDWMDKRQATFAKRVNGSIDEATEGQGGELYRAARKKRADYANEFENVGLTADLLGKKRGTSDRKIAIEDVFDKVIVGSKVDDMNKLRRTLLKAGKEGQQAWADLKAAGIERLKNQSLSASGMDSRGNPLLSPDALARNIKKMDETGKLEALYGKKQAQTLRDLSDIASVIYTAPPGSVNFSNTASALQVALDSMGTFAVTGIPAPAATVLKEGVKYIKDRKLKARISAALSGVNQGNQ